jgi:hypothetical protein
VVLDHVAQRAGALVVAAAALDAHSLGHCDLLGVERAGAPQVAAKRLLDDDSHPAVAARVRQASRPKLLDDRWVGLGRRGQVEQPVAARAALLVERVQPLGQLRVAGRVIERGHQIGDTGGEATPE